MTESLYAAAPPLDAEAMELARRRWATRAKPPGSLGRLEGLATHLAGVTGRCPPAVPRRPRIVVFAADHGVVADGASAWPAEVTGAMIASMTQRGAAINAFAGVIGATVTVVDVGVAGPRGAVAGVRDERVRDGSGNIARTDAMSREEAQAALEVGSLLASEAIAEGTDTLIGGEMGIGNTTSAAALIASITGASETAVTGDGAGVPEAGLEHKRALVAAALARDSARDSAARRGSVLEPGSVVRPGTSVVEPGTSVVDSALRRLAVLGGLEIAALAGFYLTAAAHRVPFVIDGVIACAALCVAETLSPGTATCAIAGHRSSEPGAALALAHLGMEPLLDLGLRLGEGTGAALAFPLLTAAASALEQMADLPTGPP